MVLTISQDRSLSVQYTVYKKPYIHIILQDQIITYTILQQIHRRTYYNGLLLSHCYGPIPELFCEGNFKHPTFKKLEY